jgi:type I restriction enzyme S subunit
MSAIITLPSDWTVGLLEHISIKIQDGTHFSPKLGGTEFKYITSKNVGPGRLRLESVETISREEHEKIYHRCDVRYGDLLLTKDGANTGNAAINLFREEISLLSSVAFIRANPRRSIESYILQYLLSAAGRKQVEDAMAGNAITRLTLAKIKDLRIPLPPVPEQRAIAEVLTDADDFISTLEGLIKKKEAIKQGMMQELLTGRTRLPGFSAPWTTQVLGAVSVIDPETLSSGTRPTEIIDYVSLEDVSRGQIHESSRISFGKAPSRARRVVRPLDVLFGTVRPNLQSHAIYLGRLRRPVASTGFAVIRAIPGSVEPYFVFYLIMSNLASSQVERIIAGSNYPAVSSNDVRGFEFLFPDLNEQRAVGTTLADADAELATLESRLIKTRAIKQGMMQQLLTGRIRLPVVEAAT